MVIKDQAWWLGTCDTMEIMRAGCSHCRGLPDLPPLIEERDRSPLPRQGPMAARFDGRCRECQGPIVKGDTITPRLGGGWACEECAPWIA
jgi:hypothetical protein